MATASPSRARSSKRPHPVVKPAVAAALPKPRPSAALPDPGLPGPAAMLRILLDLWTQHDRLDVEAGRLRAAKLPREGEAMAIGAQRVVDKIQALEALAIAATPITVADAVAQLILIHDEVTNRCECSGDPDVRRVPSILEGAVYALAVLGNAGGFDLASLQGVYLRPDEAMIALGEVPA